MIRIPKPARETVLDAELLQKAQAEAAEAVSHYLGEITNCNQLIRSTVEADEMTNLIADLASHFKSDEADTQEAIKECLKVMNNTPKGNQPLDHIREFANLLPQVKTLQSHLKKLARKLERQNTNLNLLRLTEQQMEKLAIKLKAYGKFSFYKNG